MYFKADKNLDYSKVLDAMDIAMHNGVRVVGMISDQKPGTVSTVAGDTKQRRRRELRRPTGRSEIMAMSAGGGAAACRTTSTSRR